MTDAQKWFWLLSAAGAGVLLYLLAPVLTPFLAGALFAYIGDPLVARLERRKLSRSWAVTLVFSGMVSLVVIGLLVLVPLLQHQTGVLVKKIPGYLDWLQNTALPWAQTKLGGADIAFDVETLKKALTEHWQQVGGIAARMAASITRSWFTALAWLANLVLIPVVTFYLLRDWNALIARIGELIPLKAQPVAFRLAAGCDAVLGAFFRGQLLVMLSLALVYSTGLWLIGLDLAFLIGIVAGLVSFVPYLGFIVGVAAAGIAAVAQFQDMMHLALVLAVFGAGQMLESLVLTPWLLGDRIGLHPLGVIFAVMAGGQLFGFVGVLLALPVAAVVMVLLRHAHERYVSSRMYSG